jgi:hypothetical protein
MYVKQAPDQQTHTCKLTCREQIHWRHVSLIINW